LIFSLVFLVTAVSGQEAKRDFNDGEFFLAMEDYEEALYAYNQVHRSGYQDNANINYRIGLCLLNIPGRKTEAIPFLEKAVTSISERYREGSFKEENAPPDALLYLGNAYRINMELEKACEYYYQFEQYQTGKNDINQAFAEQQVQSCSNAVVAMNNPVEYKLASLGQIHETHRDRYNVVFSKDLQTMAFMGENPFYNGVYVSNKVDGVWETPLNITPSIMSDGNMDVVALSPDGKTMLLAVSDEFTSNIYKAEYDNNRWNPAETLGSPINSRYFESHASFAPDGNTLYLSSNRKGTVGAMDLWRSDRLEDGSWGDPVNLGPEINTLLNEEAPFVSPDGQRLYFASQGHNSIGGFDMFYCELQPDGTWGEPVNLGYPLNTTDDDLAFSPTGINAEGATLVFAKGEGSDYDLYKFEFIPRDAQPEPSPGIVPVDAGEVVAETGEAGEPPVPEPEIPEEEGAVTVVTPVPEPEPVKTPEHYLVKPVFFDFDSYALSAEAKSRLDDMASLLQKFPSIQVEITGHTDAIGTFDYNQRLSDNRASSVSEYLRSKGISDNRLKTVGVSESDHVARNRTTDNRDAPEGRALNRRTEFKVGKTEEVVIEMEEIEVPDHLKLEQGTSNVPKSSPGSAPAEATASTNRYFIKPVFFSFDSDAIPEEGKPDLDGLAALLKKYTSAKLEITGHTDAMGSDAYNHLLSLKRAESVAVYLESSGVSRDRIRTSGAGENDQVALNRTANDQDSPKGRALNRRVEFDVSLQGEVVIEMEKIEVPASLKPEIGPITAK